MLVSQGQVEWWDGLMEVYLTLDDFKVVSLKDNAQVIR